jgi:hypothetical protein
MQFQNLSIEEVEIWIGKQLSEQAIGSEPRNDNSFRNIAKKWFLKIFNKNKEHLCNDSKIKKSLINEKDVTMIGAALVDIIGSQLGIIPITAFSMMLINYGIDKLCK